MQSKQPTLTLRKLRLPPRAITRAVELPAAAATLRSMQQATPVIIQRDAAEIAQLKAALAKAEAERDAARRDAVTRAQREERVRAITLRIVDRRADWAAKQGLKARPLVAITSQHVVTADVWHQPADEA